MALLRAPLYRTLDDKRRLETRNGAIQFLAVLHYLDEWVSGKSQFTPEILCELQRIAITQIYGCAGQFRNGVVTIETGDGRRIHNPPPYPQVPQLVDEMCAYVNDNWAKLPAHLASDVMWRVNWIHPFFGGNGRTARTVSYLILCARAGFRLPGEKIIPDLIVEDRDPYYEALRHADKAWETGQLDLSMMEDLMSNLLAKQLVSVHEIVTVVTSV